MLASGNLFVIRTFPYSVIRILDKEQTRRLRSDVCISYNLRNIKWRKELTASKLGSSQMPVTTSWIWVDRFLFVWTDTGFTLSGIESKSGIDYAALEWFLRRRLIFGVIYCVPRALSSGTHNHLWEVFHPGSPTLSI